MTNWNVGDFAIMTKDGDQNTVFINTLRCGDVLKVEDITPGGGLNLQIIYAEDSSLVGNFQTALSELSQNPLLQLSPQSFRLIVEETGGGPEQIRARTKLIALCIADIPNGDVEIFDDDLDRTDFDDWDRWNEGEDEDGPTTLPMPTMLPPPPDTPDPPKPKCPCPFCNGKGERPPLENPPKKGEMGDRKVDS